MENEKLYHVSEDPLIQIFIPRESPTNFDSINTKGVFAISERLLHNYLLPRECPRVTYYACDKSSKQDIEKLLGATCAKFVMAVEKKWLPIIQKTTLYMYELAAENFCLLVECAGYYTSAQSKKPVSVLPVHNIVEELMKRDIKLRFTPSLFPLADMVKKSTLHFSLIRMRNLCI
jgi:hypothetical protein